MSDRVRRPRDERGQTTVLIVGFAVVLMMSIALVVDTSAAYLHRQGLDTLADGAALRGADLGASGKDVYRGGVPEQDLEQTRAQAKRSVSGYLAQVGAYRRFPGLRASVSVSGTTVTVRLQAPLDLPLTLPGAPDRATVGATGSAVVTPQDEPS